MKKREEKKRTNVEDEGNRKRKKPDIFETKKLCCYRCEGGMIQRSAKHWECDLIVCIWENGGGRGEEEGLQCACRRNACR